MKTRWSLLAIGALGCDGALIDRDGAQTLWSEIHEFDYPSWSPAPRYDTPQPTLRAHGHTAIVYLNPVMRDAIGAGASLSAWPEGSLLVKDSFNEHGEPYLVAAMKKESTGWFYAEWSAAGEPLHAGSPEVCLGCHRAAADEVFSVQLPR
jgi:hypothetical protein